MLARTRPSHSPHQQKPGQYVYRYYKNNSLTLLAESAPFTVGINATLTLSVPSNVVPGEIITGTITNVLPTHTVTVERDTGVGSSVWTQEQTLVASPIISLRASGPGRYRVAVRRDTTVMTSAEFIVKPAPTIAATGSLKAGFPLNVNLGGFLDPTDRVRIDTLGQADLCAACTDPTINKPAAPTITFDNTPAAGTYQVRLLRRDQTIALKTITIEPLPNPTLTAWVITKSGPLNPNPRPECKTIWAANVGRSRYRWTKIEPVYTQIFDIATGQTIYTLANDAFAIESYACPVIPTAEAHPYGYGYGPGDSASRSFFWQVTNYAPAAGETLTIELGPGKALVPKGDCGPI